MPYFLAFTLCLCLSSCCSTRCPTPISPLSPVTYKNYNFFNDGRSPDLTEFNKTVDMVMKGNDDALIKVLSWANLTEGEESIKYAQFLLKLQDRVGEKRFVAAFESLTLEKQATVKTMVLARQIY